MLPTTNRFSLREDPTFFDRAQKHFFPFGVVFYEFKKSENPDSGESIRSKLGDVKKKSFFKTTVIIPKKKWKKASQRNYLKRLVRSAIWSVVLNERIQSIPQHITFVVFLSQLPQTHVFTTLKKEITRFFEKTSVK